MTERLKFIDQAMRPIVLSEKLSKSTGSWCKMRRTHRSSRNQVLWDVILCWWVGFGVSKHRGAFVFKNYAVRRLKHDDPLKRREHRTQRHCVTLRKIWILKLTAMKTSNLISSLLPCLVSYFRYKIIRRYKTQPWGKCNTAFSKLIKSQ
jgi:hypothetical protein